MTIQNQNISYQKKIEFLLSVLEAEEKRRDSVENKAAVLMASNAILLSAIIGWGIPLLTANGIAQWLKIGLTVIALGAVIVSTLLGAEVLTPLVSQRQRSRIMDLGTKPETEKNLFLFTRIATFKKADYVHEINSLTERQVLEQLASQIHNLSRLLKHRYRMMSISHGAFIFALVTFAALALIKLLIG